MRTDELRKSKRKPAKQIELETYSVDDPNIRSWAENVLHRHWPLPSSDQPNLRKAVVEAVELMLDAASGSQS